MGSIIAKDTSYVLVFYEHSNQVMKYLLRS